MSNIYIQEPPTNGKVLLKTTVGEIEVELWSKEAPKVSKIKNLIKFLHKQKLNCRPQETSFNAYSTRVMTRPSSIVWCPASSFNAVKTLNYPKLHRLYESRLIHVSGKHFLPSHLHNTPWNTFSLSLP